MLGPILGTSFFLIVIGYFVMEICFPATYHSLGFWMVCSFLIIPGAFLVLALFAAHPAFIILFLIVALAGKL